MPAKTVALSAASFRDDSVSNGDSNGEHGNIQ
jgi:hypothetical protein